MSDYNSWGYDDDQYNVHHSTRRSVQSNYSEDSSRFPLYERGEEYQRPEAQFAAVGRLNEQEENEAAHEKLVNSIIGYCHIFAEHILTHPFIVLRRQCQVIFHFSILYQTLYQALYQMYQIYISIPGQSKVEQVPLDSIHCDCTGTEDSITTRTWKSVERNRKLNHGQRNQCSH